MPALTATLRDRHGLVWRTAEWVESCKVAVSIATGRATRTVHPCIPRPHLQALLQSPLGMRSR